ncbi:MAG: hypothetical protein ACKPEY_08125 [Planctomycetota bacterium]
MKNDKPWSDHADAEADDEPVWQPRFSLASVFLMMTVASVIFAAGNYGWRALESGFKPMLLLALATLAGPMLVMILVSIFKSLFDWTNSPRSSTDRTIRKK